MEIERLKSLQEEEDREKRKKAALIKGSQVIVDQIQERYHERVKQAEIRERERVAMLANVQKMKDDEERIIKEKQRKARELLLEVEATNKMSLTLKEERRQKEIAEDEAIYRYN